jgi:hypothetical protein
MFLLFVLPFIVLTTFDELEQEFQGVYFLVDYAEIKIFVNLFLIELMVLLPSENFLLYFNQFLEFENFFLFTQFYL